MIYKAFQDIQLSRLGMGNMRLPGVEGSADKNAIDYAKAHEIIDYAYHHGVNYFDTAYVYNNGESEKCLGACMKKYPRDSFYIATKYFVNANPDYKAVFEEELERLQTDHIDFYLVHCLMDNNVDTYLNNGCIDYFLQLKAEGKIRYLGFSSHASVESLTKFADHHQWDFAQLQINYYDWNYATTMAEYKVLEERNIPIMVMEPVRGGKLVELTDATEVILKQAEPAWTNARWAFEFVKSLPQVQVILSGMSNMAQVEENIRTFEDDTPFSQKDSEALDQAVKVFRSQIHVPCTGCRYCCSECPMEINIPEFLKIYNAYKVDGPWALDGIDQVDSVGKPTDCIGCGACMGHCPQSIHIPDYMAELAELMNK